MKSHLSIFLAICALALPLPASAQLPPMRPADPNPWNGTWKLDAGRSSPGAEDAPQAYRFTLGAASASVVTIKWEIPELGEVVTGVTDGTPMPIHRATPTPGLKLAVRTDGRAGLLYSVYKDEKLIGGGRMMLIENGNAWVDLTWPEERQDLASELIYVKQKQ